MVAPSVLRMERISGVKEQKLINTNFKLQKHDKKDDALRDWRM
jgi:hypothetical protein